MRRFLPLFLTLTLALGACNVGDRSPSDVGDDLEGTVSSAMVERLLRDVDLAHTPLVVHVGSDEPQRYGGDGQRALEDFLRESETQLDGARVEVVQRVVEENGADASVTLTLKVQHHGETRFVPVLLEVTRSGRRLAITRARVMTAR